MKDKSLKILLGIIAVNLTLQTINQIGLFPTAYAQHSNPPMKVVLCDPSSLRRSDLDSLNLWS